MRAATRERVIRIMASVLVISISFLVPKAAAQSDKYSKMAPVDQYLMERNAEILLARSAAPDSISSDATILVLGRQGYETAVRGKNGFVCMVERSWMAAFDSPEYWNPKVRGAECLNRQAARSILPIAELRTRMVMTGHSKAEIVSAIKAAFANKQLPDLENGNMVFMMSKSAYLYDAGDHNGPHVMFFTALKDGKDWGAGGTRTCDPCLDCVVGQSTLDAWVRPFRRTTLQLRLRTQESAAALSPGTGPSTIRTSKDRKQLASPMSLRHSKAPIILNGTAI
jgi:hypothetical protein